MMISDESVKATCIYKVLDISLIFMGLSLRFYHYLMNRSLWVDEAMLALNITNGSYTDLLTPLKYNQIAPIGFLFPVKFIVANFGDSEYALRFIPFVSSLLSILLLYWIAKKVLDQYAATIALCLFAFADPLIIHAVEIKPYSSDVFFALLLGCIYLQCREIQKPIRNIVVFSLAGAVAVWISFPSAFVLAAIGSVWGYQLIKQNNKRQLCYLFICIGIWLISFGAHLRLVHQKIFDERMLTFWSGGFMPLFPTNLNELRWFMDMSFGIFANEPTRLFLPGIGLACFLAGMRSLSKKDFGFFIFLVSPILISLLISGFRIYPFHSRMILFLSPFLFLIIAEGLQFIGEALRLKSKAIAYSFVFIFLLQPITCQVYRILNPYHGEEIKDVLQFVSGYRESKDPVYIYYGAQPAFEFYSARYQLNQLSVISGALGRANPNLFVDDIRKLNGLKRIWFIFSHVPDWTGINEESFFLLNLDRIGMGLKEKKASGASAYLYDLSGV